jgi:cyanophycinase
VAAQPGAIGIGLGEDTGMIVSEGHVLTVIGNGCVTVIDGKFIDYNNIADISFGKPIGVENLIVHLMSQGDSYNVQTRKFEGTEVVIEDDSE